MPDCLSPMVHICIFFAAAILQWCFTPDGTHSILWTQEMELNVAQRLRSQSSNIKFQISSIIFSVYEFWDLVYLWFLCSGIDFFEVLDCELGHLDIFLNSCTWHVHDFDALNLMCSGVCACDFLFLSNVLCSTFYCFKLIYLIFLAWVANHLNYVWVVLSCTPWPQALGHVSNK